MDEGNIMRKRFRHKKIIEWHCPKCRKIFSIRQRCDECGSNLMRRSFRPARKTRLGQVMKQIRIMKDLTRKKVRYVYKKLWRK